MFVQSCVEMLYGSEVVDGEGYLRIGELARRTGTSPELLRAWEQRYGLLEPSRSSGGFRLYSDEDESRVLTVKRLIADGLSASEAARATLGGAAIPTPSSGRSPTTWRGSSATRSTASTRSARTRPSIVCSPRSPSRRCSGTCCCRT